MNSGELWEWGSWTAEPDLLPGLFCSSSNQRPACGSPVPHRAGKPEQRMENTDGTGLVFPTQHSTISASSYKEAWELGGWQSQKPLGTCRFAPEPLLITNLCSQSCCIRLRAGVCEGKSQHLGPVVSWAHSPTDVFRR